MSEIEENLKKFHKNIEKILNNDMTRSIMSIIGYILLIVGTIIIYVSFVLNKLTFGKIKINSDTVKKYTALGLVIVWFLFLISESYKLNSIISYY